MGKQSPTNLTKNAFEVLQYLVRQPLTSYFKVRKVRKGEGRCKSPIYLFILPNIPSTSLVSSYATLIGRFAKKIQEICVRQKDALVNNRFRKTNIY